MASKVAGYIGKIEKNGDWVAIGSTAYGVCDTAANVAEKVVDMKGFELITGATVFVKFVHENTAQNPTVNVNGTGAKGIISADNSPVSAWLDGAVLALTFDGNNWATSGDPSGSAIDEAISTVSGSLISLTDATDAPVADLKVAIEPVQEGTGDPSPDNVRPISGWTGTNITVADKNLFSIEAIENGYLNSNDEIVIDGTWCHSDYVEINGQTYTYSGIVNPGTTPKSIYYTDDKSMISSFNPSAGTNTVTPPSNAKYVRFSLRQTNDPATDNVRNFAVNFQRQTYTISFGSAGTVYGGTLDAPTGVLTVTHEVYTFTGNESWAQQGTQNKYFSSAPDYGRFLYNPKKPLSNSNSVPIKTSIGDFDCTYNDLHNHPYSMCISYDGRIGIHSTLYSGQGMLSGVQVYYELDTPQTYQLTPTEVRTLLGLNNIWADTGDVTSLTYWKVAGEGIAEAVSNASANAKLEDEQTRSMITQSSETSMVATKDYSEGDLVIIGGQLLRATENIATTTELVIGEDGNVEVVDLETVLKELSARIGALEE